MSHAVRVMPPTTPVARLTLPLGTRISIFLRLLAIQASWNYEILLGNGIGFCTEPALRLLPGGKGGEAYHAALARHSQYFNAHPYFAGVAVGALIRAELDGEPAIRIERFRTALCGPLGSVGDRLVWAAWLPFCSVLALLVTLPAQDFALSHWRTNALYSRAVPVGLAAMVAGGAVWKLVHLVPRARWLFLGGLLCGLAALAFT